MTYQERYQPTVNQPTVVQPLMPVVIPVQTDLTPQEYDAVNVCSCLWYPFCFGCMGFCGFLTVFVTLFIIIMNAAMGFGLIWDSYEPDRFAPLRYPIIVLGSIGAIFAVTSVGFCYATSKNEKKKRSQDNTEPISEPFTHEQINQGSPRYVPVQSGVLPPSQNTHQGHGFSYPDNSPSASYSAQMSNLQQSFHHGPVDNLPDGTQNFGLEKASFVEYDQQSALSTPPQDWKVVQGRSQDYI